MQNSFVQTRGDQIIFDRNQLTTYAIAAAVFVVVVIAIAFALKKRKKNFIKTIPTNLKDEA